MSNNNDYIAYKKLIEDTTNITENNQGKVFVRFFFKFIGFVVCLYFLIYILTGVFIHSLNIEQQINLENQISRFIEDKSMQIPASEKDKLLEVRDKILKYDYDFPKTSKLDIRILNSEHYNALCYPNGTIYITKPLYNEIKQDEEVVAFVLAHEMAHYKHKDHLHNIKKIVAGTTISSIFKIFSPETSSLTEAILGGIDFTELNYSRSVEAKADKYAGRVLIGLYGSTEAGVKVLKILGKNKKYPLDLVVFSSHPTIEKRIKNLRRMK